MNKEDRKALKSLKKLMNIKPPKISFDINQVAADYILSKLREKSCAEQLFPSTRVN